MKVVLVDDEKGIVDGLKKIIGRYIPECEIVGIAYNGLEGINVVQKCQPDIVITDIRMPKADGLEMIESLKKEGCQAKFILLSGYADFEYARRGMRLGVKFYINKPVEEEELEECVARVSAEIENEKDQARTWNEFVLKDILTTGYDAASHESHLANLLQLPITDYQCISALLEFGSEPGRVQEGRILGLLTDGLRHNGRVCAIRYEGSQFAVVLLYKTTLDEAKLAQDVKKLQEELGQRLGIPVAAGIGQPCAAPEGLSTSFKEAQQALRRSAPKKKDVIAEIKEYVTAHYDSSITLADLSARFFINPYYLSQLFKEKTGDTYLSYVMGIRISKAKELLEETDLKVYEICRMVGYADTNHFSKLFEKMTGSTPSEFRKHANHNR